MNKKDLFNAIGEIDDELIEKAEEKPSRKNNLIRIIVSAAACLCIVIAAVFAVRSGFTAKSTDDMAAYNTGETVNEAEPEAAEKAGNPAEETADGVSEAAEEENAADSEKAQEAACTSAAHNPGTTKQNAAAADKAKTTAAVKQETKENTTEKVTAKAEEKTVPEIEAEVSTTKNCTMPENCHMFNGVITEVNGDTIVVEKYEHKKGTAYSSTDPIYPTGELYQMTCTGHTFNAGEQVAVYYVGEVKETSPMQIELYQINKVTFPTEN